MKFCEKCGKEIPEGAQFCSTCGTKTPGAASTQQPTPAPTPASQEGKKPSKFKSGCLGIIGLFIIIALIGSCMGGKSSTNKSTATNGSTKTEQAAPTYDYSCDVEGVGKVKGMTSSKVGVAIAKLQEMGSIDAPYSSKKAQGIFKVLYVVVSNNQKDAITVDANSYKLIDEQGREFSHSTEGDVALQMSHRETLFLKKINPGNTLGGYIAYDVPKDAKIRSLQFKGGMTGDKKELPFKVMMD